MTNPGPDGPVEPHPARGVLPPDEAWPLAALTALSWHLLAAAGLAWLVLGPLADPPLAPGEDPPTGLAGYGYGWGRLVLHLVGPPLVLSLVLSLVICWRAGRGVMTGDAAAIWRGTWAALAALPCACALWVLALAIGSAHPRDCAPLDGYACSGAR